MANYAPLYLNSTSGNPDKLDSPDGILADIVDCAAGAAAGLFDSLAGGTVTVLSTFAGSIPVGDVGSTLAAQGSITAAQNLTVTGNTLLNGNVALGNAAGDDITFPGQVAGDITFDAGGARAITIDSQSLTISTTTAGTLALNSVAGLDLDGNAVTIDAVADFSIGAANASDITVTGAAADLTLGARAATVTLNENGSTALVGFTATSLIGALNELNAKTTDNLLTYKAGEAINAGDLVCLDWDAGDARTEVYLADKDTAGKNYPVGISLTTDVAGNDITVATTGEVVVNTLIAATNEGLPVFMDNAGALALNPPGTGVNQIVGIVTQAGIAGAATITIQMLSRAVI